MGERAGADSGSVLWSATHDGTAPTLVQAVVDGLAEGLVVRDADHHLVLCNAAAEAIVGLPSETLADFPELPRGWVVLDSDGRLLPDGEHPAATCLRTGVPVRGQVLGLRRPDGTTLWLSVNARHLPDEGPDKRGLVIVSFIDITPTRRSEEERRRLEGRLRRVTTMRLAAAAAMVGAASQEELLHRTCEIAVRDAGFRLAWIGVADEGRGIVRPLASSGAADYLGSAVVTLADDDPRSHGPTGTAIRENRPVINHNIATDPKMGPWRAAALEHGFGASAAFPLSWDGERHVLTVYATEADFFNAEESRLLQQFVGDLARGLREAAGRHFLATVTENMGEGLVVLDRQRRLTYVNRAATDLLGATRAELEGRHVHELLHPGDTGADCTPETCELLGALASGATAPREADFRRRDGTVLPVSYTTTALDDDATATILVFSDDTQRRREAERVRAELDRLSWAQRIRDALREERFCLHAQPIIDIATGRVVQHELLIRMRDGAGELIAPGAFLPTAEACGLITDIDRWVIRQVGVLARAGHPVEFNLSAASVADPSMLAFIEETLAGAAQPGQVVCEVTETAFLADRAAAEGFLARLAHLGIDVALDDFGSGYGGFTYLKTFPAAKFLKIDAEFVSDLAEHPASHHVVEAIVRLAKALGKFTVAEGVEDAGGLQLLRRLGVDLAQGFGIARPQALPEVFGDD